WTYAMGLGVCSEHLWGIALRVEGDRDERHIAPGACPEGPLHLDQMPGGDRTGDGAGREHEVDGDHPALHEIVIEPHRPPLLRGELDIKEMSLADGRYPIGGSRSGRCARQRPWRSRLLAAKALCAP